MFTRLTCTLCRLLSRNMSMPVPMGSCAMPQLVAGMLVCSNYSSFSAICLAMHCKKFCYSTSGVSLGWDRARNISKENAVCGSAAFGKGGEGGKDHQTDRKIAQFRTVCSTIVMPVILCLLSWYLVELSSLPDAAPIRVCCA